MYKILITSSNNSKILNKISHEVLTKKLSPCIHLIDDIESFYLWNKKVIVVKTQLM